MKLYPLYEVATINNLKELIDYCAATHGSKTAFCWLDGQTTVSKSFIDFKADIRALGTYLVDAGIKNEKITVIGENSYEWILTFFATVNGGNIIVPVDKELENEEIEDILARSGVGIVVYSDRLSGKIDAIRERGAITRFISIQSELPVMLRQGAASKSKDFENCEIENTALCAIYYTSGTTGQSKGVMLSHKNLASNALNSSQNFFLQGSSLLFLPLCHTFATTAALMYQLYQGNQNIINSDLKNISNELVIFRPCAIGAVPLFIETMHQRIWAAAKEKKKDKLLRVLMVFSNTLLALGIDRRRKLFSSVLAPFGGNLEMIICGGAPLDKKLIKAFRSFGIEIYNGYGITECSPVVSLNRNNYYKDGSAGIAIPGCSIKIIDGEICVKGDNVMLGYYNDPQATQETFQDGWFKTGDLGHLDDDGFLYVTGRKKNIIVLSSGFNVSPEELETRVKAVPLVCEVVVYQENNRIVAEIYPDTGTPDAQEKIRCAVEELNARLPKYKRIDEVRFRETEFEKTTMKKIKRHAAKM